MHERYVVTEFIELHCCNVSLQVEAKRAVPRSEMSTKEQNTTTKPAVPTTPQSSARPTTPQNSPQVTTTPAKAADGNSPEAKEKSDAKVEDYAYNKVFVGGLHYDTRDRKFCRSNSFHPFSI